MFRVWTETKLWGWLNVTGADKQLLRCVSDLVDQAEQVLRQGATIPLNFTLHDDQHSFRVAERMADLLGSNAHTLSDLELSILLTSAYLHDIGMCPPRMLIAPYQQYLLSGSQGSLSKPDVAAFSEWIDQNYPDVALPIAIGANAASGIDLQSEILSYYIRHKHNDWSEEWIRNVALQLRQPYPAWFDNIVTVCRSHHEGLNELKSERFDAYLAASPSRPVNLRLLAALLRVADVMEFDPERTPSVILEHRDIPAASRIYWHKDHQISMLLDGGANSVTIAARTPSAIVHRAVLDTIDAVNAELSLCRILADTGLMSKGNVAAGVRAVATWQWPAQCSSDVAENGSFVFINGAFQANTRRVLSLLSGTTLYGSPLVAIRELLQNSFDAVSMQIGLERLDQANPADRDVLQALRRLHTVRLTLESEGDALWLRCADDGIGMTRDVIEKSLLISGAPKRPEVLHLERAMTERGLSLGRTGQFGIGTLSYFMIAEGMELVTRRSGEAGDVDGTAWRFVTDGLNSFGELSRESRAKKGSDVRLKLRTNVLGQQDPKRTFEAIRSYCLQTVAKVPCRFEVRDQVSAGTALVVEPGWTTQMPSPQFERSTLWMDEHDTKDRDMPATDAQRAAAEELEAQWSRFVAAAAGDLRWFGPREWDLSDGKGTVRASLPYYELPGGAALAVALPSEDGLVPTPSNADFMLSKVHTRLSWRGFRTSENAISTPYVMADVDLVAGAKISVDRHSLSLDDSEALRKEVTALTDVLVREFLVAKKTSIFYEINRRITHRKASDTRLPFHWVVGKSRAVEQLTFPFAELCGPTYNDEDYNSDYYLEGKSVRIARRVKFNSFYEKTETVSNLLTGGELALADRTYGTYPARLWRGEQSFHEDGATFPPEFSELAGVVTAETLILNRQHPLNLGQNAGHRTSLEKYFKGNELPASEEETTQVIRALMRRRPDRWNVVRDQNRKLWSAVLQSKAFGSKPLRYWQYTDATDGNLLVEVSDEGSVAFGQPFGGGNGLKYGAKLMPWPNDHWRLRRARDAGSSRHDAVGGLLGDLLGGTKN